MTTTEITSEDVAAWMQEQAQKIHQTHNHVQIQVGICQNRDNPHPASFSIYCAAGIDSGHRQTIEECFEAIGKITPNDVAADKRKRAATLLAEAEELERGGI
jgi:hypothetical protein